MGTGVSLQAAAAWHIFLNTMALEVLRCWSDRVDRIVYRHTIIPFVSARLDSYGERLVREQDGKMTEEYWREIAVD